MGMRRKKDNSHVLEFIKKYNVNKTEEISEYKKFQILNATLDKINIDTPVVFYFKGLKPEVANAIEEKRLENTLKLNCQLN